MGFTTTFIVLNFQIPLFIAKNKRSSLFPNPSDLTPALPLGTLLRTPQRQAAVSYDKNSTLKIHLTFQN
jgi:hypothetical protein